jgi:hypothetical protein
MARDCRYCGSTPRSLACMRLNLSSSSWAGPNPGTFCAHMDWVDVACGWMAIVHVLGKDAVGDG